MFLGKTYKGVTDDEITYKTLGSNWFVISGYSGDNIFYQKSFVGDDENTFLIEYPQTQKEKYSDMTTYLEKSFKPGPLIIN